MDKKYCIQKTYRGKQISASVEQCGTDFLVRCSGGDSPHIGSVCMAMPYCAGGRNLASLSLITAPTHRDDSVAKKLADDICRATGARTVAVCGIHYDNADPSMISEICNMISEISAELCSAASGLSGLS